MRRSSTGAARGEDGSFANSELSPDSTDFFLHCSRWHADLLRIASITVKVEPRLSAALRQAVTSAPSWLALDHSSPHGRQNSSASVASARLSHRGSARPSHRQRAARFSPCPPRASRSRRGPPVPLREVPIGFCVSDPLAPHAETKVRAAWTSESTARCSSQLVAGLGLGICATTGEQGSPFQSHHQETELGLGLPERRCRGASGGAR